MKQILQHFGLFKGKKTEISPKVGKTYFCSELIADCYRQCGVLAENKNISTYWPGDFS